MHANGKLWKSRCEKLDSNQANNFALYVNINYVDHRYLTQILFNLLHILTIKLHVNWVNYCRTDYIDMTWYCADLITPQHSQSLQLAVFHQSSPRLGCRGVTLFILRLSFKSRHSSEPNYNPLTDAVSAVIAIPHNSPQQTSAAFLAELVNTMSDTCPALRALLTYSSYSHQIYSYT